MLATQGVLATQVVLASRDGARKADPVGRQHTRAHAPHRAASRRATHFDCARKDVGPAAALRVVIAYIVMAFIVVAYTVMACIVMAIFLWPI